MRKARRTNFSRFFGGVPLILVAILLAPSNAQKQETSGNKPVDTAARPADKRSQAQLNVNWLYGSYVPKGVPLESLDRNQRFKLYTRQTYTTWGIYIKITLFTIHDQINSTNPEWGDGRAGFVKRFGTRQAQFVIQNSIAGLGNGVVGWEPRYDRCNCDGFWPRTHHALARNFVTYASDEKSLRPQLMLYVGAFAGGSVASTWEPAKQSWWTAGYQAAVAQILIGAGVNWIGEFASEIGRTFHRKRRKVANSN